MGKSLTPGQWERAYREKRRLRAGELFERGTPNVLIAEALGVSGSAVSMWRGMWEEGGAEALGSLGRPGYPCLLTEDQVRVLVAELERGAVAHGFENERWTLARVNEVIDRLFGVCFAQDSGVWRLLKRIGWSAHRAGRVSAARDPEAIARFREVTWPAILDRARAAGTWVVFEDEAAAMLNARGATTWAERGRRVWLTVAAAHRRKLSMAGFVCYRRGAPARLYYAFAPDASFTEDDFGPLLLKLRAHLGARRVILVWDRLSAHATSRKTRAFLAENASWLQVELLPTAAPELNPVEQVWAWIKGGPLANLAPPDLDHLADAAGRALNQLGHRFPLLTAFLRHTELAWT